MRNAFRRRSNVGARECRARLVLLLWSALACAKDSPTGGSTAVASVAVSPDQATVLVGGQTVLTATTKDAAGNVLSGRQVAWTSDRTDIATANGGSVTGVAVGSATVTATSEGVSGSAAITVTPLPVKLVDISPSALTLLLRGTGQLAAQTLDSLARPLTGRPVAWASLDPGVASVDPAGLVTGEAAGGVWIRATSEGVSDSIPTDVVVLRFASVSAGGHSCGVTLSGAAWCWGQAEKGELGHGRTDTTGVPVPVMGGHTFASIVSGNWHTCGLVSGGAAYCWGVADMLGVGMDDTTSHFTPEPVTGGLLFQSLVTSGEHTCGIAADATAHCWGRNYSGRLGIGAADDSVHTAPKPVTGGHEFAQLSASGPTCGVTLPGDAYCWGSQNDVGQLGIGGSDANTHPAPELVAGGGNDASVSAGSSHVCALTPAGEAHCWGSNFNGELGATTVETCSAAPCATAPIAVSGGHTFRAIAAGTQFTCGVDDGGQLYCWGGFAGGLGGGNTAPTALGSGIDFVSLSAGGAHVCGVSSADLAYCWGINWNGSVGNGELGSDVAEPALVFGQP